MYYEKYKPKKKAFVRRERRHRKRRSLIGSLFRLIITLVLLFALAAGALYILPVSLFMIDGGSDDLSVTKGLGQSALNILLIGTDTENEGMERSDSIMIASIGYDGVKLTSIVRDTMVNIPGRGRGKINSAYAYGGAALLMKTINENFGLNISKYMHVDFVSVVHIVDSMGGVDIDIKQEEMEQINWNVRMSGRVFSPLGYEEPQPLMRYGEDTHLNGLQALGYARIRKIDSDFVRASRQRKLLAAVWTKLRAKPYLLVPTIKTALNELDSNLTTTEMLSCGTKVFAKGVQGTLRLPVDGTYTDDGSAIKVNDYGANTRAFKQFVYGTEGE